MRQRERHGGRRRGVDTNRLTPAGGGATVRVTNESRARRGDQIVDVSLQRETPFPPPTAPTPVEAPIMPAARPNVIPHTTDAKPTYVPPPLGRSRRSRAKTYTIGAIIFLAISIAGYIGFRSYIYGDDAPPVPVLDDLGN